MASVASTGSRAATSLDLRHTCGGPGWAFGCTGATAMRWSPGSDWQPVESPPGAIEIVGPCAEGVLARSSHPRQIGLWPWGGAQWAYWQAIEGKESRAFLADPRTLVLERTTSAGPALGVYRVGPTALEPEGAVQVAGTLAVPRLAAFRGKDGGLGVVSAWTIHALDPASGGMADVAPIRWPGDRRVEPGGVAAGGSFVPAGAPAVVIDLRTGGVTSPFLPPPTCRGVEHLWRAVLTEDRPRLLRLLGFLAAVGRRPLPERYDFVFEGPRPVALVWACGIERAASALPPERDPALALWRLWLDGEPALAAAIDAYLGARWHRELLDGLVRFAGLRLAVLALDPNRGRASPVVPQNVRDLFERLGPAAAPRVMSAMSSPDPAVSFRGAVAAGASEMGARLAAAGPRFEGEVRRLMGSPHASARSAACELVGPQRLRGLADALLARLSDDEFAVRLWAARSAASVLDPSLARSLAVRVVEDVDEAVRRTALSALGRSAEVATLLDALGDPAPKVREAAVAQLLKRMPPAGSGEGPEADAGEALTRAERLEALDAALLLFGLGQGGSGLDATKDLASLLGRSLRLPAGATGDQAADAVLVLRFVTAYLVGGTAPDAGPAADAWERLWARLGRTPAASPTLALLAEAAEAARPDDPDVADRIAVLALSASRGAAPRPPRDGLAARLRAAGRPSPGELCLARVRQLAAETSRLGRLAAHALAASGGRPEREGFEERITGPDFARFPLAFVAWVARSDVSHPADLAARLLRRRDLPVGRRLVAWRQAQERVSALTLSSLPVEARLAFFRQVAEDPTLPLGERRAAEESVRMLKLLAVLRPDGEDR